MRTSLFFTIVSVGALFASLAVAEVTAQKLSLPKGPGSVEGLATADYAPSLATGTASYSVAIQVPPGARALSPELALTYDSAAGVGELGLGWRLAGVPSLRRRTTDGLPRFDESDSFELVGLGSSSELVEVEEGVFRPRYEDGSFLRARRVGETQWEVRTKGGKILHFGGTEAIEEEGDRVAAYLLRKVTDLRGQEIRFEWETSGGYGRLLRVIYSDLGQAYRNEVSFHYEERPDVLSRYSSGIRQVLADRVARIEVTHGGDRVRRYDLSYGKGVHPQLSSVTLVGSDGTSKMPASEFSYSTSGWEAESSRELRVMKNAPGRSPGEENASLADLNGDGLPDLLIAESGAYRSYLNLDGAQFASGEDWTSGVSPTVSLSATGAQLTDMNGDGSLDLLVKSGKDSFRYLPTGSEGRFTDPVTLPTLLNVSFEDPNVRLVDLDGDRRTDFLMSTPSGLAVAYNRAGEDFGTPEVLAPLDERQDISLAREDTDLCDLNGDRVQDLCILRSGSLTFYLGRGRGFFEPAQEGTGVPAFSENERYQLRDLNGDGWDDLVRVGSGRVFFALARAEGRFSALETVEGTPEKDAAVYATFADMNGSGSLDVLWVNVADGTDASWTYLELFPEGRAGLLTEIKNGLGKHQRIDYRSAASHAAEARALGSAWKTRCNIAMPVVSRVTVESGLGDPPIVTEYVYRDGTYDADERTFAAFGEAETWALGDESSPTLVTETHFDPGLGHRGLRGVKRFEEKRDVTGWVFSQAEFGFAYETLATGLAGIALEYGYQSSIRTVILEGDAETAVETLSEVEHDAFGNPTREANWGIVSGSDKLAGNDEAITHRTFANDAEEWVLGKLITEELTDGAGDRSSAIRRYYDGDAFVGLPLGQITRGELTREEAWVGPEAEDYELVLASRFDDHGLVVETKNALGGGKLIAWDPSMSFIVEEAVKLSPEDTWSSVQLVEKLSVDGAFGTVLSSTDFAGSKTDYGYDVFGRLARVVQPGDSEQRPTLEYRYEPGAPLTRIKTLARVRSGQADVEVSESVHDGLGRKRVTFTQDGDRWLMAGLGLLDARGRMRRAQLPRWAKEGEVDKPDLQTEASGHDVWLDALGREIRTRSAEGIEAKTQYSPLTQRTWDGGQTDLASVYEHTPTVTFQDGLGRVVAHGKTLDGAELLARYSYDPSGRLLSRTDPEGNIQRFSSDGRGRRTVVDDPDLGVYRASYDALGNVVSQTHPDGETSEFSYDLSGRRLSEDWNGDGEPEIVLTHDEGAAGKLVRVEEPSGFVEHTYDARGQVVETLYSIDGVDYVVGSEFDAQGREVRHIYPDGSSVNIRRNGRGQLAGYGSLVDVFYGADGLETERKFSSGLRRLSEHDRDGRFIEMKWEAPDGAPLEQLRWEYDRGGNLVSVRDLRPNVTQKQDRSESYVYDNLYRLKEASGTWGTTQWSYSASGNLLERTSSWPGQDATDIEYGERPHALTRLAGRTVSYNARGQMVSDGERDYEFDGIGHLVRVERGDAWVDSVFGYEGVRRMKTEKTEAGDQNTTHFIDAWTEVKNGEMKRYVVHGGERLIELGKAEEVVSLAPPSSPPRTSPPWSDRRMFFGEGLLAWLLGALVGAVAWLTYSRARGRGRFALPTLVAALFGPLLATALVVSGCSSGLGATGQLEPNLAAAGDVASLKSGDRILMTDQVGSALGEVTPEGKRLSTVALMPYGVSREDGSEQTRKFAGSPRDSATGLDHMGARFYAADLGVWTSADPIVLSEPEKQVTAEFGAAHPYAYANHRPLIAADAEGKFWHIVLVGGGNAVWEGAAEALSQYVEHGKIVDGGRICAAAAGGALTGALVALNPAAGLAYMAAADVAGGMAERAIASGGESIGGVTDVLTDAAGSAGGKALEVVGTAGKKLLKKAGTGGQPGPIQTPYALALQSESREALEARQLAQSGATLYKGGKLGRSAGPESQFWSLESPMSPGYAQKFGIPEENAAFDFIETATLRGDGRFITRDAPGPGVNIGGAIEVVVEPGGVRLTGYLMP